MIPQTISSAEIMRRFADDVYRNMGATINLPVRDGELQRFDDPEGGALQGTMVVGGQVDQGNSNNKEMRLLVTLEDDYSDGLVEGELDIVYNGGPIDLDLSLKGLPNADLTGSFVGSFTMTGDLLGEVLLDLAITGETEEGPSGDIQRKAGTIRVLGTATSDYGVFDVDVSL